MRRLRRGLEIGVSSMLRGVGLYLGFYLYIFVLAPLVLVIEALMPVAPWSIVASYAVMVFFIELVSKWPQERLEPVLLLGPQALTLRSTRRVCRSFRPRMGSPASTSIVASVHRPLHRQPRFGRTRIR